jgi:uncharacterized membrane protein
MKINHYNQIAGQDTGRIVALSDGVFSVAMTLLVLEIRVPVLAIIHSDQDLINAFFHLKEKFLVYLLAFMTIGIFWVGHSSQYKHILKSDRNLSWINLIFLLFVTLLPFTTAFLGDYFHFIFPVIVYWLNILMLGALLYANWRYALRRELVNNETKHLVDVPLRKRIIVSQSLYALGAALCFFSPFLSVGFIIIIQLNYAFGFTSLIK